MAESSHEKKHVNYKFRRDVKVGRDLEVERNVKIEKDLIVNGSTRLKNGLNVIGGEVADNLIVLDNETVNGNLTVNGTLNGNNENLKNLTVTEVTNLNVLNVSGAATFTAGVSITGGETVDTLNVTGNETVGGLLSANGGLKVVGGETADNLAVTGQTILNNVTINGDITPVNGTFSPGTAQFPTIQSIFDFLQGKAIGNVLIDLLAPISGVKIYDELLNIKNITSSPSQGFAMPQSQYPLVSFSELSLQNPGLSVRGDPRYIAGMAYIGGAQLNYFNDSTVAGYVRKLGTPYGIVTLSSPSPNQITIAITAVPAFDPEHNTGPVVLEQPNFTTEGVVPGDQILIRDDSTIGVWQQVTVTAIIGGNTIAYSGTNVPNLTLGAAVIILPRVQQTSTTANPASSSCNIFGVGITFQGVWFKAAPSSDAMDVSNGAIVKLGQCFLDSFGSNGGEGLVVGFQSQAGTEVSGIVMHNAIRADPNGLGAFSIDNGRMDSGDWCFFDAGSHNLYVEEGTSQVYLSSVNSVGGGSTCLNARLGSNISVTNLIGAYKNRGGTANGAVVASRGAKINLGLDNLQINNTGIATSLGIQLTRGAAQLTIGTTAPYGSATTPGSNIVGCTQGVLLNGASDLLIQGTNALGITNCGTGIIEQGASKFSTQNNIVYSGTPIEKTIEVQSIYSAVESTETPSGIFTNTVAGLMDSTSTNQLIDGGAALALTITPALVVNGVSVYKGKRYSLYSAFAATHSLMSTVGPVFFGNVPAGGPYTTVNFPAIQGAGLEFTVQSFTNLGNSMIIVHSFTPGITFLP